MRVVLIGRHVNVLICGAIAFIPIHINFMALGTKRFDYFFNVASSKNNAAWTKLAV